MSSQSRGNNDMRLEERGDAGNSQHFDTNRLDHNATSTNNDRKKDFTTSNENARNVKMPANQNSQDVIENIEELIPLPPNGGWGWVIVCASLLGNLIVDGISYSFGVFLLEFVDAFQETKGKVSLVGSLLSGVYLFVGPIVSAMTNKFGCRPIVIAGSVVATAAFVLATLSPNIDVLIVTYGVMGGFGLGMIYLPCIVGVGYYFDTKRAFATGIAVCGSGLGTFIFPPLSEFLLSELSWQGGLLIIAGIMFQGCICGTLMRPLKVNSSTGESNNQSKSKNMTTTNVTQSTPSKNSGVTAVSLEMSKITADTAFENKNSSVTAQVFGQLSSGHETDDIPQEKVNSAETDDERGMEGINNPSKKTQSGDIFLDIGNEFAPLLESAITVIHPRGVHTGSMKSVHISKEDLARPLYRKDIFYSGSVMNIPEFHSQGSVKGYITSMTVIPTDDSARGICNRWCSCLPKPVQDVLSEMLDVTLLRDVSFMLICFGNFTAFLGMYVPFVFLVDRSASMGIDRSRAAFLISVIGISNTAGRIVIGKVADLHILDSLVITYISMAIMGVATGLVPFCNTYPLLATNAAIFGLGMAAFIALSSIVICDRLGVEKLTNAFGLLTLMRGSAAILGPPFAGFMFDTSGSYDLSFFIGGLLLLAGSGCLVLLHLPALRTTRKYPRQHEQEVTSNQMADKK